MLRLYGAPQGRLAAAVALFAPQWRAEAQWKSRGAETLLAVHADTPTGLKKAAQSLRSSFGADVYGAGDTSLAAAAVQALEAHDRLLACGDAAAGALLVMDEVMTGFRVSSAGWYGVDGVAGDLYTFGKVMSGGLPSVRA